MRDLCNYDNCNLSESLQGNLGHLNEQWTISPNSLLTLNVDLRNLNMLFTKMIQKRTPNNVELLSYLILFY